MRVSRGRQLGAIAVLAAMAVGVFWLGSYLHSKGFVWAANFSNIAGAGLAAVALLMPTFSRLVRTFRGSPPLSRSSIRQARDDLAVALAREWAEEERVRQVNDPRPLPVCWEATPAASVGTATTANATAAGLSGRFEKILPLFSRLSPPRLIILGHVGAGKSVLVIKLARDLLAARQADMPVPVILPAAAWDLDAGLSEWIADQLCRNHPGLAYPVRDATGKVTTLAFALATDKMVLPIIDGLDELPEEQRGRAIEKINKFGSDAPLVLTSRTEEFLAAVAGIGRGVARAAVVEVLPLEVRQSEQYLTEATAVAPAGRWDSVFAHLNSDPGGPLAYVLCTPLMLWLARTVYESAGDPAELVDQTRFGNVEDLEDHLLDAFVPTVYAEAAGNRRFRCRPRQAERWLGFLAANIDRTSQPDFAWWRLIRATPAWQASCVGLRIMLYYTAAWTVTNWVLMRHGHWDKGAYVSHATWHSILVGGPLGCQAWPALDRLLIFRGHRIHHDMHVFAGNMQHYKFLPWISFRGFEITLVVVGIVAAVTAKRMSVPPGRLRIRPLSVARAALTGVFVRATLVAWLVFLAMLLLQPIARTPTASPLFPTDFLHQWSTWRALSAVAATGIITIPVSSLATPLDVSRSASPADALRFDRQAAWSVWALRQVLGIAVVWLWAGPEIAVACVLLTVIVMLVRVVLGGPSWAAQGYDEARVWLFARGRMPWRILRFLADAHRRGVLRQVGAVYQFRHIRLQERLAATHPLMATRMDRWARRELLEPSRVWLSTILREDQMRAADDENARQHGWVITFGPDDLRTYRDPRFDQLTRMSDRDDGSIADGHAP